MRLAQQGEGRVNPNPLVGALIVKDDDIIARGWHHRYGDLHAERDAFKYAEEHGIDCQGSTMYVTLEPCCHQGHQPPCTEAIVSHGIRRVVVGLRDPNPLVGGKGIEQLRQAGIEVDVLEPEDDAAKTTSASIPSLVSGDTIAAPRGCFTADVMPETVRRTSLASLKPGSKVNLERALTLQTRLGGHIVSGHVDGTGKVSRIESDDNALWLYIRTSPQIMRYIIEKGSITIQGVSLTVAMVSESEFAVSLIPHTQQATTLHTAKVGDLVNLENDLIAKYVERLMPQGNGNAAPAGSSEEEKINLYRSFLMA